MGQIDAIDQTGATIPAIHLVRMCKAARDRPRLHADIGHGDDLQKRPRVGGPSASSRGLACPSASIASDRAVTLTLSTLGLLLEGAGLLLAIDPILDMGRTAVNVSGQMLVAVAVARRNGLLDLRRYGRDGAEAVDALAG